MTVQYEVLCDGVSEARVFRFDTLAEAKREAERVCRKFNVEARVVQVQVLGKFVPEAKCLGPHNVLSSCQPIAEVLP